MRNCLRRALLLAGSAVLSAGFVAVGFQSQKPETVPLSIGIAPASFVISEGGKQTLRIEADGSMKLGDGVTANKAAREFADFLSQSSGCVGLDIPARAVFQMVTSDNKMTMRIKRDGLVFWGGGSKPNDASRQFAAELKKIGICH